MKTKNLFLTLMAGLLLTNCAEDIEKQAQPYLLRARQSYASEEYALAKLQIDSIKQLYPKAIETRTQAQACSTGFTSLKAYTDSLIAAAEAKAEPLTSTLYLDKDTRYQDIGTYYASRHRTERNVGKSYLRPQTDEHGTLTITAFYRGRAITPQALRFTAPDGSYVDLQPTAEPYVMSDATGRTERTDFAATPEEAYFVARHATVKATLLSEKSKAQIPFAKADTQALTQVAELAATLQAITTLQTRQEELARRIAFYEQRQQAR